MSAQESGTHKLQEFTTKLLATLPLKTQGRTDTRKGKGGREDPDPQR